VENQKKEYFWLVFNVCFATFMSSLDVYIVNISLPAISAYFNVSTGRVSEIVLCYLLFLVSTMLIFGKLADRIRIRNLFIIGQITFVAGSLFCSMAGSLLMLDIARCIQGIGGAILNITAFTVISGRIPSSIRGWAFGNLSVASALGLTLGAPLGGFLTGYFSWRWIFLINIPVGIMAIILALKVSSRKKAAEKKPLNFDIKGAILSFFSVSLLLFALNKGKEFGWTSIVIISCLISSFVLMALLIYVERKHPDPLLDLSILSNRNFTFTCITGMMAFILLAGHSFIIPFYLELLKGLKPQMSGIILMIYSVVYMFVAPAAGRASDKINPARLCSLAMLSCLCACLVFAFTLSLPGITSVIVYLIWLAISLGMFTSPNNNLVMSFVPKDKQGTGAGVFNLTNRISLVLGVCFFENIFSCYIHSDKSLSQAGIAPEVLIKGFQAVYIGAAIFMFTGLLFSFPTLRKKDKKIKKEDMPLIHQL